MYRIVINIEGIRFYSRTFDTRIEVDQWIDYIMHDSPAGPFVESLEEYSYGEWSVV